MRYLNIIFSFFPLISLAKYAVKEPPLTTDWTYKVGTNPWPEYPRPQLQRSEWQNLNGVWKFTKAESLDAVDSPPFGSNLTEEVLVPSCLESGLSGIQGTNMLYSWYKTEFLVPTAWSSKRVLLNFGAVDYQATVFVNGKEAGSHTGGYFAFTVDVTDYVQRNGTNELLVFVHDPTDSSSDWVIPVGKQTLKPSHIFYRPCSGIWQTVWIEAAPNTYITQLDVTAAADGKVTVNVASQSKNATDSDSTAVEISIIDRATQSTVATQKGAANKPFTFDVPSPALWSPDSPILYNITVKLGADEVTSYTGFRTISRGVINGIQRPLLNGKLIYPFGTLDQGYWPDGLYTPPNKEAMVYDIKVLKDLGFNMVRKHIKVEPSLFYQACDELGLLVIQDMPSLSFPPDSFGARRIPTGPVCKAPSTTFVPTVAQQQEFARQLDLLIHQLKPFPSIFTWVIFNEGWGQELSGFRDADLVDRVRKIDSSRLINAASGWNDHGAGDFDDNHHYATPQCGTPFYSIPAGPYDPSRIGFQGEFGGVGHNVSAENLWKVTDAVNSINQTYEISDTIDIWNYRSHTLLSELRDQTARFACSGGVWTQTTDVEGEVNGLLTYDRRILRTDKEQWRSDIKALYDAAAARGNASAVLFE